MKAADSSPEAGRSPAEASVIEPLRAAQPAWAAQPVAARLQVVRRFRQLLAGQGERVVGAVQARGGRPVSEICAAELLPLADACRFLEREATALLSPRRPGWRGRPLWLTGVHSEIRREPFGLVLIIAPANYPVLLPAVQVLQALVAGNAVLLKPGVNGLDAALEIARLLRAAGLPEHLLSVLPEAPEAAQWAVGAGVDKVFFTGSARVGIELLAQLAPRAIPAVMELSGCDAAIVRADADLDLAVRALVFGLRLNSGRTCIAPRRVLVVRAVATEFEGRLARALADCATAHLSPAQHRQLTPLFLEALSEGAHLLAGEARPGSPLRGPLVLAGVAPNAALLREDLFGPVMTVMTVADDDEAVHLANENAYALGATVFSRNARAAQHLAQRLHAGVVVINDLIAPTADPRLPFGGRKLSGFGVTRGREGLLEMTTQKVVMLNRSQRRFHFDAPQAWQEAAFPAVLRLLHGGGLARRFGALRELLRAIKFTPRPDNPNVTTDVTASRVAPLASETAPTHKSSERSTH